MLFDKIVGAELVSARVSPVGGDKLRPYNTAEIMRQKYGQNFLVNDGIINKIVSAAADLAEGKNLVEIGPGKGALTLKFIERGLKNFAAVEIDADMVKYLSAALPAGAGVKIFQSDFLEFDLNVPPPAPTVFVSNLPYIYAAEILDKVLDYKYFAGAVFMFQREQARRVCAAPGSEFYGPLSVLARTRSVVKSLCRVSPGSFNPPPKVESEVLIFTLNPAPHTGENFKKTVRAAFAYKRKNILNSLSEVYGADKARLAKIIGEAGINPSSRAQDLPPEDFIKLQNKLYPPFNK